MVWSNTNAQFVQADREQSCSFGFDFGTGSLQYSRQKGRMLVPRDFLRRAGIMSREYSMFINPIPPPLVKEHQESEPRWVRVP